MSEMSPNMLKAFHEMQAIGAPVFDREYDGTFILSAEENGDRMWADYFARMHVDPECETIADQNNIWFEWENPACLIAYDM